MMPPPTVDEDRPSGLLRDQAEANAKLVVAAVQAQDVADEALGAQRHAETRAMDALVREEELRATAEFRERLIGIIGHDLRSPLATILMACQLLGQREDRNAEDARYLDRIVRSGERMGRMITQLVEFTRARLGGGFDLKRGPADLAKICSDIAEELRISSNVAAIHVTTEGDPSGVWDADRLSEVVSNIAGNAVDHAMPGTAVLIRVYDRGDAVVCEIENRGDCIPADALPFIFSAFRRAEASADERGGHLGLGLYIAHEVVRSHGGILEVASADGVTKFTFRLPRAIPTAAVG